MKMKTTVVVGKDQQICGCENDSFYVNQDECVCSSCMSQQNRSFMLEKGMWWGLIIPPIWLGSMALSAYLLLRSRNTEPVRFDMFLELRGERVPQEPMIRGIDDFRYLDHHFRRRERLYDIIGWCFLGLSCYCYLAGEIWFLSRMP